MDRTEALIAREEAKAWAAIAKYKPRFQGKKVLLITGGVKSWSVVAALQEAGLTIVGSSVKKSTKEDKERLKELSPDVHQIDDLRPREMYKMLKDAQADIMLSGGRSQFVALKAKMPWLDINQERHYAYAGYVGVVELVKQIDKALSNPVWEQVRKAPPWEETSWEDRADADNAAEAAALAADPELAEAARRATIVCQCKNIDVGTIEDAIRSHDLTVIAQVTQLTEAGGGCGSCKEKIAAMLAREATTASPPAQVA
jgi:nitrogenase molybdenum-cofactor synthesis protein NifE